MLKTSANPGTSSTPYLASPDKCLIGHAQAFLYLHGAYEMCGCFLGLTIYGFKFRRIAILPDQIIVVETIDTDKDRVHQDQITSGSSSFPLDRSMPIDVAIFLADHQISEKMPFNLKLQTADIGEALVDPRSRDVYIEFRQTVFDLMNGRKIGGAAAEKIPEAKEDECEAYHEILREGSRLGAGEYERQLIVAMWDKLAMLAPAGRQRRPRSPTKKASKSGTGGKDGSGEGDGELLCLCELGLMSFSRWWLWWSGQWR